MCIKTYSYQNYSEKKLNKLKKLYAYHQKYGYLLAGVSFLNGVAVANAQLLVGNGFLIAGLILAFWWEIAFAWFDLKRTFCLYKTLSRGEIDKSFSRNSRYNGIALLFGILGLIDAAIWILIGFITHGLNALHVMRDDPIWLYFALLSWAPWFICSNRVRTLNFIRLSQDAEENM